MEHYQEAERLLDAVERRFTGESVEFGVLYAVLAAGHALLAAAPRRATRRPVPPAGHAGPGDGWMFGGEK